MRNPSGQLAENSLLEASDFAFAVPAPLGLITVTTTVVAVALLALLALIGSGWGGAVALIAAVAGPIACSQLLKHRWLDRPDLLNLNEVNTFPSGHATVVAALAFGLLLVAPRRLRVPAALLGGALLAVVAWQLLAYGWHRPSDVIGGIALAACGASVAVLLRPGRTAAPAAGARGLLGALGALGVLGALAVVAVTLLSSGPSSPGLLLAGQIACVAAAVLAVTAVATLPVRSGRAG